ncbi:MAG TPA: HAMP domain-containing sensor histidine kinase [Chitinophagaceae bacterium]
MKTFIVQVLKKHVYLLIAAGWFLTIAFIINTYLDSPSSAKVVRNSIEDFLHERERDFSKIVADTALLRKMTDQTLNDVQISRLVKKEYTILIYEPKNFDGTWSLQFWNNQYVVAEPEHLQFSDTAYFEELRNGFYEVVRRTIFLPQKGSIIVIGMIPVRWGYFIPFQNLPDAFVGHDYAEKKVKLVNHPTDLRVKSSVSNATFHLERREQQETASIGWLTITVIIIGVLMLLYFLQQIAHEIAVEFGLWRSIMFLVTAVLLMRGATYFFPELLDLRRLELFDPTIYSSGMLQSSLGDLLINAFLFCWLALFIRRESAGMYFVADKSKLNQWIRVIVILAFLVLSTFYFANLIRSLIADGRISFNVIDFFSLTIYSAVGFIVLACLALGYFFLSQILVRIIYPTMKQYPLIIYMIVATMGLLVITFVRAPSAATANLFILGWLLFFMWLLYQRYFGGLHGNLNPTEVLFWLFIFSLSIAGVIITENSRIEWEQRKRQAERLLFQADPSSERRLSIALTYFDNDFLYPNFERFKTDTSNRFLKDSLANKNFSGFLDEYDNRIYTFLADGRPLFNEEPVSFDTLNTIFSITDKTTSIPDIKYFEKSFDKFAYIFKKEITDSLFRTVGYLFVLSEPKSYKSEALIPELFRQPKEVAADYSPIYSYAIYNNGGLISYYNDYEFSIRLKEEDVPKKEFDQIKRNGYDELWYRHSKGKVVIIAKKDNTAIEAITLFAYLFSAFLFLLASFRLISLIIQSRFRLKELKNTWQLNIRSQIHSTIIFISLLSFVVIGIATIIFFVNRYNRNNLERLSRAIQIMTDELQTEIADHSIFNDNIKLYETGSTRELELLVNEVAEIHDADINLYDLNGNLIVSSNPMIYDKSILSNKMDARAFYKLHNSQLVQFVNEEEVGLLSYLSIYCPVRDDNGNAYAYLNIPSFTSQQALKQEISNFLVTIINLNAFIFLIAGAIALFITNRITSSFTLIGQKMQQINLGKLNEEIRWDRTDEISELVKEYNTMVHKLEDSAAALAKSEREGAWRQMARQVAHEIKNPLTPMKLSIQYLQKAIDNNSPNVKELTGNVARTLVEQIDHLSKIASDFSQFANIGNVRNEVFDLHEVISSITALYEANERLEFTWTPVRQRVMVMMDKTQINRLLTNLLQNAIEACYKKEIRKVSLTEEIQDHSILIKITDNGEGIPDAMQQKIFVPNFTTKSSGTGLGLAMSKAIVELVRGDIWFETAESVGTTFFVKLPVLRVTD